MKNVACIIARTASKRLPNKVLLEVGGKTMIEHIIDNVKKVSNIDEIYICTSQNSEDKILLEIAEKSGVKAYAGSENAVIERMLDVAKLEDADNLIRITGDNIFTDSYLLDTLLKEHIKDQSDYSRVEYLPIGVTGEIMSVKALEDCYMRIDPSKSEYLLLYMFDPSLYKCTVLIPDFGQDFIWTSLTVDTPEDFERTRFIFSKISKDDIGFKDIVNLNQEVEIPFFNIDKSMQIRMPDRETISYEAFRQYLQMKIEKSKNIKI